MYSLLCASCSAAIIMYVHLGMWQALALSLHALQIAPAGCRSRNEISTSNLQSNKIVRGQMNRPTCDHSGHTSPRREISLSDVHSTAYQLPNAACMSVLTTSCRLPTTCKQDQSSPESAMVIGFEGRSMGPVGEDSIF